MKPSQASAGFTLQEMLVVMAITGIVAAAAIPSFRDFAIQRSINAQITDLTSAMRLARSEAIKRGREVSMCPTADPNRAKPGCNRWGYDWSTGYIIFVGSVKGNDQYIRIQQGYSNGGTIKTDACDAVRFRPNGVLKEGGARVFEFYPKHAQNDPSLMKLKKKVCLSDTGVLAQC